MPNVEIKTLFRSTLIVSDEFTFKKVFLEFYPKLVMYANAYVRNMPVAEDIAEDVMINLWNIKSSLSEIKSLKFYLLVATKNSCFNYLKKTKKHTIKSIEDYHVDIFEVSKTPEDIMMSDEKLLIIQTAIQRLPPKCKFVFVLIKEEGLKYNEAAELLNVSIKTIETQMTIAFKKIANNIGFAFPYLLQRSKIRLRAKSYH